MTDDLIRHRIDFDPSTPTSYRFAEAVSSESLQPSPIPWPQGLEPTVVDTPSHPTSPLPKADALVVTYTKAEGFALADVLTPGHRSTAWTPYRSGWDRLRKKVRRGAPSLEYDCAAHWALTQIGTRRVVVVKSEMHPAVDGPQLPMVDLWRQMIEQVEPRVVITTGTAGGIGADTLLGDVIVSPRVRWDCIRRFGRQPFAHQEYVSPMGPAVRPLAPLLAANADRLSPQRTGVAKVWPGASVVTTDFFAMDTADDHFGLRAYEPSARAVEMDDAALGLAMQLFPRVATPWLAVRNASDPQMQGADLAEEEKSASAIYERYGYWTSINSVIACWAVLAGLPPSPSE